MFYLHFFHMAASFDELKSISLGFGSKVSILFETQGLIRMNYLLVFMFPCVSTPGTM